jgi:tetratricopeptide (TPR) repeat protein
MDSISKEIEKSVTLIFSENNEKIKNGIKNLTNISKKPMSKQDKINLFNGKGIGYYFLDSQKSKEYLQRAKKSDPNNSDSLHYLGHIESNKQNYEKAKEHFQNYLKKNPNDAHILTELGAVHYHLKNFTESQKKLEKALEIDKDEIEAHHYLAHILEQNEGDLKVIEHYDKILNLDKERIDIILHKAWHHYNMKRVDDATIIIDQLEKKLTEKDSETHSGIYEMRGNVLFEKHEIKKSRENYEKAIRKDSNNYDAKEALAHLEWVDGDEKKALKLFNELKSEEYIENPTYREIQHTNDITRTKKDILEEIKRDKIRESQDFELKTTMYCPVRQQEVGKYETEALKEISKKEIIPEVFKTIIAFLNTDGGDLIIGIQEKPFKKIYGVETDFKFLGLNDWDEWNRKTTSMITTQIGDKAIRLVKIKPIDYPDEDDNPITLAWIQVSKGKGSIDYTFDKDGRSFERVGAASVEISAEKMQDIMKDRNNQNEKNTI